MEKWLKTCGGRIRCIRCTALSSRSRRQCGRPALSTSRTLKCQHHGGRGSGAKTAEGRARLAMANLVHGREARKARAERSAASARLSMLEDAARVLGMLDGPRLRGRKAAGYRPIKSVEAVKEMVLDDLSHRNTGVVRAG
jgi:hypothetical protein